MPRKKRGNSKKDHEEEEEEEQEVLRAVEVHPAEGENNEEKNESADHQQENNGGSKTASGLKEQPSENEKEEEEEEEEGGGKEKECSPAAAEEEKNEEEFSSDKKSPTNLEEEKEKNSQAGNEGQSESSPQPAVSQRATLTQPPPAEVISSMQGSPEPPSFSNSPSKETTRISPPRENKKGNEASVTTTSCSCATSQGWETAAPTVTITSSVPQPFGTVLGTTLYGTVAYSNGTEDHISKQPSLIQNIPPDVAELFPRYLWGTSSEEDKKKLGEISNSNVEAEGGDEENNSAAHQRASVCDSCQGIPHTFELGQKWSSAEFVRRFLLASKGCILRPILTGEQLWSQKTLFHLESQTEIPFYRWKNRGVEPPQCGDILVYERNYNFPFGHCAVIVQVLENVIRIAEQQTSSSGAMNKTTTSSSALSLWGTKKYYDRELSLVVVQHHDKTTRFELIDEECSIYGWMSAACPFLDPSDTDLFDICRQPVGRGSLRRITVERENSLPWLVPTEPCDFFLKRVMMGGKGHEDAKVAPNAETPDGYYILDYDLWIRIRNATISLNKVWFKTLKNLLARKDANEILTKQFLVPEELIPLLYQSIDSKWSGLPNGAALCGRFDFGVDGNGNIKTFEFNCDSSAALLECGDTIEKWSTYYALNKGNGSGTSTGAYLNKKLEASWRRIFTESHAKRSHNVVHFMVDDDDEERYTALYMMRAAQRAGFRCKLCVGLKDFRYHNPHQRFTANSSSVNPAVLSNMNTSITGSPNHRGGTSTTLEGGTPTGGSSLNGSVKQHVRGPSNASASSLTSPSSATKPRNGGTPPSTSQRNSLSYHAGGYDGANNNSTTYNPQPQGGDNTNMSAPLLIVDLEGIRVEMVWKTWSWDTVLKDYRRQKEVAKQQQANSLAAAEKQQVATNNAEGLEQGTGGGSGRPSLDDNSKGDGATTNSGAGSNPDLSMYPTGLPKEPRPKLHEILLNPTVLVMEPFWKLVAGSKAMLPYVYQTDPKNEFLLNASFEITKELKENGYVSKPVFGRAGQNITLHAGEKQHGENKTSNPCCPQGGMGKASNSSFTSGNFHDDLLVYQERLHLQQFCSTTIPAEVKKKSPMKNPSSGEGEEDCFQEEKIEKEEKGGEPECYYPILCGWALLGDEYGGVVMREDKSQITRLGSIIAPSRVVRF